MNSPAYLAIKSNIHGNYCSKRLVLAKASKKSVTAIIVGFMLLTVLLPLPLHASNTLLQNELTNQPSVELPNNHKDTQLLGHSARLDQLTSDALLAISVGDWPGALHSASLLTTEFPDYALGQWLLAESHNVLSMSDTLLLSVPNYPSTLIDLLLEAQARAQHNKAAISIQKAIDLIPMELVQAGAHIDNLVLVDLASSQLYLFDTRGDKPQLKTQHYISSGEGGFGKQIEGDLKTPLGVYRVHGYRSDKSLPPLYGAGALMLNYPNALDRSLGRTGSGIWLHGNPRHERSRSPRSSEGCVTMANDHLSDLYNSIDINRAVVMLSHNVKWQTGSENSVQRERYQKLFEQYRAAWVNNEIEELYSLYATDALPENLQHSGINNTKRVSTRDNSKNESDLESDTVLAPAGIRLKPLAGVRVEDVSVLINPGVVSDNAEKPYQHLVMSFELPSPERARITLYWEQLVSTGQWQIRRESIEAGEA